MKTEYSPIPGSWGEALASFFLGLVVIGIIRIFVPVVAFVWGLASDGFVALGLAIGRWLGV